MEGNKIQVIIMDDEIDSIKNIESLLNQTCICEVIGKFTNAIEGLEQIKIKKPDILFLNLNLSGLHGIELLRLIHTFELHIHVVIITTSEKEVLPAVKYNILTYVQKPVLYNDLNNALSIFQFHKNQHSDSFELDKRNHTYTQKIKIPTSFEELFFTTDELLYLVADGNYTKIHLITNETLMSSYNLGKIHQILPTPPYIRISRSSIINYLYLKKIDKRNKVCILKYMNIITEIPYTKIIMTRSGLI